MCLQPSPPGRGTCDTAARAKTALALVRVGKRRGCRMWRHRIGGVALLTLVPLVDAGAHVYTVTPIDTFGGASSQALGLNEAGAVVGPAEFVDAGRPSIDLTCAAVA